MDVFLLADIGGTNARFALYDAQTTEPLAVHVYKVAAYETLDCALDTFIKAYLHDASIIAGAFAVAGMVLSDVVALTNCPWIFCKDKVIALLKTERVHIFNDFAAIALALNVLQEKDLKTLQQGLPNPLFPKIVMGPGTGLGVAALRTEVGDLIPFPTEAGHVRYAPNGEHERELLLKIEDFCGPFVSAEHLVSGPGLVTIYKGECSLAGIEPTLSEPADIVEQARQGNSVCRSVLNDFASIFGAFASTIALQWLPFGGIYLTGGVLQKMGDDFNVGLFLHAFRQNARMSARLTEMPIHRVLSDIPAFDGLSAFLRAKAGSFFAQ